MVGGSCMQLNNDGGGMRSSHLLLGCKGGCHLGQGMTLHLPHLGH